MRYFFLAHPVTDEPLKADEREKLEQLFPGIVHIDYDSKDIDWLMRVLQRNGVRRGDTVVFADLLSIWHHLGTAFQLVDEMLEAGTAIRFLRNSIAVTTESDLFAFHIAASAADFLRARAAADAELAEGTPLRQALRFAVRSLEKAALGDLSPEEATRAIALINETAAIEASAQ